MNKNALLKNTVIYSIGEIVPKLISFILLPIFTIYLSASDYGIISYTNSVMFFLFVFSSLALNTYLLREYYECKNIEEQRKLIGSVFLTILLINMLMLIIGFLFGPWLVAYFHLQIPFYPFFSLLLLNNFCEALSIIPLVIFRVREDAFKYVTLNIVRAILLFLVTYTLIVYFKWGVLGNFYGRLFVNAVFVLVYICVIVKYSKVNFAYNAIRKSLAFSLPLIPGAIGYLLMSMSDRIILERYVSLSDIGVFSVAYTLAYTLSIVIQGGYRSFEPQIYREYNNPTFPAFVEKVHRVFMFVVFILAITIAVFSKDVLILMTKGDFVKGYKLIPLILIGVIATAQNTILGSIIIAEKNTTLSGLSTTIGGSASILFNLSLIPIYGIYAAAIASAVAYVLMNVIVSVRMKFKSRVIMCDMLAFLYFIVLSGAVLYLFGNEGINLISVLSKVSTVFLSLIVLFFIYRLKMEYFSFLFSSFKTSK